MKLLREPLLHFLLIGAVIFAVYTFRARHKTDKPGEIVVTQGTVENLVTGFTRTWQRPPTHEELQGLLRDYVREEAAYREAMAMGLDRDDTIVRRRLRQKLEFISDDMASRELNPTTTICARIYSRTARSFQTETTFTFRQVYLDPQKHGEGLPGDATRALAKLRALGGGKPMSRTPAIHSSCRTSSIVFPQRK